MTYHQQLMEQHPIRRTAEQKQAFRAWFTHAAGEMGYAAREETLQEKHVNLVIGDPETAQAIFTAHYDTPARSFLANLMTPRSRTMFILRQVMMIGTLCLLGAAVGVPVGLIAGSWRPGFIAGWLVYMGTLMLMMYGPANPTNANDNTSGVAAILETMARVPEESRGKIAVILFDNEEKGTLGSKAYAKAHPDVKAERFLINLDCVGNGDQLLLLARKEARETPQYAALTQSLVSSGERTVHLFPLEGSIVNSDQKHFTCCTAVLACRRGKQLNFFTDRIHTIRDTLCDQGNLDHLAEGFTAFIHRL